ncbi:MAG: tetratricopeptide (TPR) repeat protein [Bradymonadia bacterium]|jgi:tetratricopeptide (TPR) repeat protein
MFRITLALLVGLAGPVLAAPADDSTARIEALAQKASARYSAGDYADAVEMYLEAYRLGKAAALLYNVAVIYDRKINDRQLAITYYRRYIAAPDADPSAASRATERVQTLKTAQAKADAQRRTEELASAQRRRDAAEARDAPPPAPRAAMSTTIKPAEPNRIVGWLVTGAGVVALGAGVGYGLGAASDQTAFDDSASLTEKQDLRNSGQQKALIADVLMGVGAAALITGVVLLVTADTDAPAVGFVPTADGQGGAVFFGGSL